MSHGSPGKVEFLHIILTQCRGSARNQSRNCQVCRGAGLSDGSALTEEGTKNRKRDVRTRRKESARDGQRELGAVPRGGPGSRLHLSGLETPHL